MPDPALPSSSTEDCLPALLASETATRLGIDNTPPATALDNLRRLTALLAEVRGVLCDVPLAISSGYRCAALNAAVGGAPHSAHLRGLAVDFTAPRYGTVLEIAKAIATASLNFDKLIVEYGRWVHLAIAEANLTPRRELLSIGAAQVYVEGLHAL